MKKIFFLMSLLSLASLRAIEYNEVLERLAQLDFINEPETGRDVSRFSAEREPAFLFTMEQEAPSIASSHRVMEDPTLSDDNQECMHVMFYHSKDLSQDETEDDVKFREFMQGQLASKLRVLYYYCKSLGEEGDEEDRMIICSIKKKLDEFESLYYKYHSDLQDDKYENAIKEIEEICRKYQNFDK